MPALIGVAAAATKRVVDAASGDRLIGVVLGLVDLARRHSGGRAGSVFVLVLEASASRPSPPATLVTKPFRDPGHSLVGFGLSQVMGNAGERQGQEGLRRILISRGG